MRTISTSKPTVALKKKLNNLFGLAISANTNDEYDVWFELTGHVDWIYLGICKKRNDDPIFAEYLYYQGSMYDPKKASATIKKWEAELMNIINPQ
ncbi:hypothetical protein [Changchengzhania lutea]|uniref:hypothetical protein n=1 Tax=Changchengzhania lutea TaxID=2049305 RepID=UPI00115EAEB4|nr:hypothetical protein [Changchengzhania lutea]